MSNFVGRGIVNVGWLNMRASPGGAVLDILKEGTKLYLLGRTGGWLEVMLNGVRGYVASRYIRVTPTISPKTPEKVKGTETKNAKDKVSEATTTRYGEITAGRLNFRDTPNGHILRTLIKGDVVEILGQESGWTQINSDGKTGYVSSKYIRAGKVKTRKTIVRLSSSIGFRFEEHKALAPDGTVFGKKFRRGIFNYGTTSISDFITAAADKLQAVPESNLRVMEAVSENEGKFEAVNTWDNAFLSIGLFQWTAGVGSEAGELAALLWRLMERFPDTYHKYFGQYGLEPHGVRERAGSVARGYLKLDGQLLGDAEDKNVLRSLPWAYRCWLAAKNENFRIVQLEHALSRVDSFYQTDNRRVRGKYVGDYITSEYGVAQLLDQHVNRPAHVPLTLSLALESLVNELNVDAPEHWRDAEEQKLISAYLELREKTSMTDACKRAANIKNQLERGTVSDARYSFVA
jgi:uncharacterized protein YraI